MSQELNIDEVGGRKLLGAQSVHGKTYVYFSQKRLDITVFSYDWAQNAEKGTNTFFAIPKDSRIRALAFMSLVGSDNGIVIVPMAANQIYELTPEGSFIRAIQLRDTLEPGERVQSAYPDDGDFFHLVTNSDGHQILSRFNMATEEREIVYRIDESGDHDLIGLGDQLIRITLGSGELWVYDQAFREIKHISSRFEIKKTRDPLKLTKGYDFQGVSLPMYGADKLTLLYAVRQKGKLLFASARFNGETLLYSRYRPLAKSPDGTQMLLFDYEKEEVILKPADFTYKESKIPPLPE